MLPASQSAPGCWHLGAASFGATSGAPKMELCWAVAKLVRHQALDLAFEGSSPSRPAIMRRWI